MAIGRRTARAEVEERKTEQALRPLEKAGWMVVHDIPQRYGNYDHIAVGPAGIYLFETKNLQGIVDIRSGMPHLSRRHDPYASTIFRRYRPRALPAAADIKEQIQEHSGHSIWVQAVVVFWSEFPEQLVEDGRCVYIHGSRLPGWLGERPLRLDEEQIEDIAGAVQRLGEEHTAEIGDGEPAHREGPVRRPRSGPETARMARPLRPRRALDRQARDPR